VTFRKPAAHPAPCQLLVQAPGPDIIGLCRSAQWTLAPIPISPRLDGVTGYSGLSLSLLSQSFSWLPCGHRRQKALGLRSFLVGRFAREAPRVHHAARRCGGCVADRGARAAGGGCRSGESDVPSASCFAAPLGRRVAVAIENFAL
jgi:hypothetical protein